MAKRKRTVLPPRRLRMKREQRLQSARSFIGNFKGRNIARGYSHWFGVDRRCAVIELTMLGVRLEPEYTAAVYETARVQEQRAIATRLEREEREVHELLRRVEEGETFEMTDWGNPVAVLSPPSEGSPLERLRALGEIEPATADLDDLPEPLVLPRGIEPPSAVLRRLRRDER